MARPWLAVCDISSELPAEVGARAAASEFNTKAFGTLVIYTVYVIDSLGPADGNLMIAGAIAQHSKGHQRPWFAVGYFNMMPLTVVDLLRSIGTHTDGGTLRWQDTHLQRGGRCDDI